MKTPGGHLIHLLFSLNCVLFTLRSVAAPASFQFFQIPGATTVSPVSLNDGLSFTGSYTLADGSTHGFLCNGGSRIIKFDVGAVSTQPAGINSSGEIAGTFSDAAGDGQGFLRLANGSVTRFKLGNSTQVTDLNASGTAIGVYVTAQSSRAFFRTKSGIVVPFTVPGSTWVYPESINDSGEITGFYFFEGSHDGGVGGFVRSPNGTVSTFVSNGGIVPLAINQMGVLTGWYAPPMGSFAPFVRQASGTITHFHVPGTLVTQGMSINAAGVIAGSYTTVNSENPEEPQTATHGFLRTSQGAIESFDAPGAFDTSLTAVNAANVALGYSQGIAGPEVFLLTPGGLFAEGSA